MSAGRAFGWGAALIIATVAATSLAQPAPTTPPTTEPATSPPWPPEYTKIRSDENYGYLANPANRTDWLDPIKHLNLDADGNVWVSFGGEVRDRYEDFNHANFGRSGQDDNGYNLFRFLPYADLHLGPDIRVFSQFRTADIGGNEFKPRGRDEDSADIQQLFAELDLPIGDDPADKFTLRAGRQQIVLGRDRLVGISDFSNAERDYDGVRATLKTGKNTLDAIWFKPVLVDPYEFDDEDGDTNFFTVYDTYLFAGTHKKPQLEVSLYGMALYVNNTDQFANGPATADEDRYTLGNETRGSVGDFDFDAENDWQFGTYGDEKIEAFSTAEEVGYTFHHVQTTPRPFIAFDLATGDRNPNNGHLDTFNQLFPSGHTYFGWMDFIGRQNIIDLHPGVELTLYKSESDERKVTGRVEYHQFWRESDEDALYTTTGDVSIGSGGSDSREIGGELDTILAWQMSRHWNSYLGYSHFWPGQFIKDTGSSRQVDFVYLGVQFTF